MWVRRLGYAALAGVLVLGAVALWQKDRLIRLRATTTLFAPDRIVHNFSHMDTLFESQTLPITGTPTPMPKGAALTLPNDWQNWLERRAVTGVIVVHEGQIRHESYHLGTNRDDLRISWSLAKSYLSALFGVLVAQGAIADLDDPVIKYAPDLAGSAYDTVSIRNVLQMSSGVSFNEDYFDFFSDINRMGRVLALGGSMDRFAASQDTRFGPPGEIWRYVSIDTHVLAMVARGATGQSLSELLAEHILTPMGSYGAPYYLTDGYRVAFALGGLNMTLRDYARLGELFRLNGAFQGRQIVPENWVAESTAASAPTGPGQIGYGYQWWIPAGARDGAFLARGVYGQYILIDRQSGMVMAITGADRNFRDPGAFDDTLGMFETLMTLNGDGK